MTHEGGALALPSGETDGFQPPLTLPLPARCASGERRRSLPLRIGRPIPMPVELLLRPRDHVDVGIITPVALHISGPDLQQHRLALRPVLDVMSVRHPGLEARAVAGPQH